MFKHIIPLSMIIVLSLVVSLTGCGEPPPPTPTPTPIPYDIDLSVNDSDGNPITGAEVSVDGQNVQTDTAGMVSITNTNPSVSLSVSAPGYISADDSPALAEGSNAVSITLELDPYGLLPVNACSTGETMLYVQDFQNGKADEWQPDGGNQGWSVEGEPDDAKDLALTAKSGVKWTWLGGPNGYSLDNSVWRVWFKLTGNSNLHFNFRFNPNEQNGSRYFLAMSADHANLVRYQNENHVDIGGFNPPSTGEWHLLEMSYYDGDVQVWVDHQEKLSYQESQPWQGGTVNFEPYVEGDGAIYFDDISLCQLSAPFETIPRPKTGLNLNVSVVDAEGSPVQYASVMVKEMGSDALATQVTDEAGSASWVDLPKADVNVTVNAPGFFAQEVTQTIQKDTAAELSVSLERDEYGMLASQACGPDEKLVYSEDIQDSDMQGWTNLMNTIDFNVPGWSIITDPDQEGNVILVSEYAGAQHAQQMGYDQSKYGDAVLRFWTKMVGDTHLIVGWHSNGQGFILNDQNFQFGAYMTFIYSANGGRIERFAQPEGGDFFNIQAISWGYGNNRDNKWHLFEISTYQGELQIWRDGKLLGKWTDPQPIPEGTFSFEMDFWKPDTKVYLDDLSVCELSAPFVTNFQEPK